MQNKKITLRYLYRHAGKVAKEAQKGVSFDVYSRESLVFRIDPLQKKQTSANAHSIAKGLIIKQRGRTHSVSKKIDKILYGKN